MAELAPEAACSALVERQARLPLHHLHIHTVHPEPASGGMWRCVSEPVGKGVTNVMFTECYNQNLVTTVAAVGTLTVINEVSCNLAVLCSGC